MMMMIILGKTAEPLVSPLTSVPTTDKFNKVTNKTNSQTAAVNLWHATTETRTTVIWTTDK